MSLEVGSQCSYPLCKEIDFLPIFCRCQLYFCREHSAADTHGCTYTRPIEPRVSGPSAPLQRCAVDKCSKPSLESFISSDAEGRTPAKCPSCDASFCAEHRHPKSHSCIQAKPTEIPKNLAARALLAKNFPSTSAKKAVTARRPPTKIPTDPVKLAQFRKLESMKMRQSAVPVDPKDKTAGIPQEERVHVKVAIDNSDTEKVFWVRKSMGTGRVLDLIASQLGISSSDASPLELFKVVGPNPEDRVKCRNDQTFSTEVEEGSTLAVCRT
ncbi:AN1-type zinc finger protein 1 [Mycena sanguinolenta]|uniref:AN1-type zinc finger protein 1 n=1 Tax=Mycena sanguinolenta TaxID=230812 RepID=A0A8H6YJN9_9AGAR|nr:AN1-type zinc finger protein 1 [Mycena sanguinolenta]